MASASTEVAPAVGAASSRRALVVVLTVVFLGLLQLWPLYVMFGNVLFHGAHVTDFRNTFYPAAEAVRHGAGPYGHPTDEVLALGRAYVYPPLTALVAVPFTLLSLGTAQVLVLGILVGTVVLTLRVLGVDDWRCYGLVCLWPPFLAAVKTGNITALLALCAALAWRYRDSPAASGASVGVSLAAKLFLWPLVLWQGATRRWRAAALAGAFSLGLLALSWAVVGFAGLVDYPDLLRRLQDIEAPQSYTLYALGLDLGAPDWLARAAWAALALALLVACAAVARRGDDRRAFVLAIAATLACSPIVWLNYFILLVVAVAVAEPSLGPAWFVPLAMYASASTYNGTTFQNALTIAAAAVTVALALRSPSRGRQSVDETLVTPAALSR